MAVMAMFPLGLVLYPGSILPLHIFEPRFRALAEQCLAGDQRFGVVLIERGYEVGGGDERSTVGTVAKIIGAGRFPDGRYALETIGVQRIRVTAWLPDNPFPRADVEEWPDEYSELSVLEVAAAQTAEKLRRVLDRAGRAGHDVAPATVELPDDPLAASYAMAAVAPLATPDQQRLLKAAGPLDRLAQLGVLLDGYGEILALEM